MRLPACISAAIAVGSTTKQDQISPFSNHALQVRHMAPGSDINSAKPGGGYQVLSGTSMATPHVAGAFALLRDVRTNATVEDISAALECTGVPVTRVGVTERRINVAQAKAYLLNPPRAAKSFQFNDPNDGSAWFPHIGGWAIFSGHLQADPSTNGWKIATTTACNEGLNIAAKIGKSTNAGGVIGVLFKAQFTGFIVGGYLAGFNPPNSIVFLRLDGYNLQTDSGLFKQFPCANRAVDVNNYNTLTVQSRGGVHKLLINGTLACTVTDHTYGTGRLGVATFVNPTTTFFGADFFNINPVEAVPSPAPEDDELVSASALPLDGAEMTRASGGATTGKVDALLGSAR
jgi:subtilisin family serine protease